MIKNNASGTNVLLSLGSNLGEREENIELAVFYLIDSGIISSPELSSIYESEPVGVRNQPWFLNSVISGETVLPFYSLLQVCKSLEYLMGRVVRMRWHEREIDIDILLYGSTVFSNPGITLPHPRMHERRFVLEPAAEIASGMLHPVFNKSIAELLAVCPDNSAVRKLPTKCKI